MNFVKFIKRYSINIPIIQRDYVQGRKKEETIRNNFINDIFQSLQNEEYLNLEFIYGNISKNLDGNDIFEPIDGQQRLTTLYLVTLFLALKEGKEEELKEIRKNKLTYEVRNSSKEFCDELRKKLTYIPDNIKEYILNQKWYDNDWRKDQTVQSMIEMLQAIQEKYNEEPRNELYERLKKYISFKFINTEEEELEDDTYIKLNARGVSLTSFEEYKSSFLEFNEFNNMYAEKIDNDWNQWIWKKIDIQEYKEDNSIFDKAFSGIFRAILTNEYAKRNMIRNPKTDVANKQLENLINTEQLQFSNYEKLMKPDIEQILINIGKAFEFFINNQIDNKSNLNKYIDSNKIINEQLILTNKEKKKDSNKLKSNVERCEFYAICLYAIQNYNQEFNEENYTQWIRIARNIIPRIISSNAEYTIIINNLYNVYELIKNEGNYLNAFSKLHIQINDKDLAKEKELKEKTKEEVIKAKAMLISDEWKELIEINDENNFLAGETNFLLDFCGIENKLENGISICNADECLEKYKKYTKIKNIMFPDNEKGILAELDRVFEDENDIDDNKHKLLTRAMFALSEYGIEEFNLTNQEKNIIDRKYGYLVRINDTHYTFLSNSDERDYTWRNLFKKENRSKCFYFKILMDNMINGDAYSKEKIINRLYKIITDSKDKITNWKKYFIVKDDIYKLMNNRINLIKIENDKDIFLLKGKADSSNSLPLFFIALDEKAKEKNLDIKSNENKLTDAWTTGLYGNLNKKKKINKINQKDVKIYMDRVNGTIRYYKNISNLELEKSIVDNILKEIENEFNIEFNEILTFSEFKK